MSTPELTEREQLGDVRGHVFHNDGFGDLDVDAVVLVAHAEAVREDVYEILSAQLDGRDVDGDARRVQARVGPATAIGDRPAQRPASGLDDEARLFHQRNELSGLHESELGTAATARALPRPRVARRAYRSWAGSGGRTHPSPARRAA